MLTSLILILLACGDADTQSEPDLPEYRPIPLEEASVFVRERLMDGSACFAGNARYCVDDADFVTAHIQAVLDERFDGVMPDRRRDLLEVSRRAKITYEAEQFTFRYVRKIEAMVRENYYEPITKEVPGKGVSVALGVPPGQLTVVQAEHSYQLELKSPFIEDGALSTAEAARLLSYYQEHFADAQAIQLKVSLPQVEQAPRSLDYRLGSERRRVVIRVADREGELWRSAPVRDWSPYASGEASLALADLQHCRERPDSPKLDCEGDDLAQKPK